MVKEIKRKGNIYFQCEECKFIYKGKEVAKQCEVYCKKHNSCSLEITKHAVEIN